MGSSGAPELDEVAGRRRLGGAFLIEIERIRPDESQPRRTLDEEDLQELSASVRQLGILQPIAVRYVKEEKLYRIISGERRYRSAFMAGLKEIPCWVQNPDEKDLLIRQITENWQRSELHPMDLALSLAKLRDALGYSQKQISELTGKSEAEVSKFLGLLDLNPAVQEHARQDSTGEFGRRQLMAVAKVPVEEQPALLSEIREKKLTATETEKIVRERKAREMGTKSRGAPVRQIFRYATGQATVLVSFRRRDVGPDDIRKALQEALAQIADDATGSPK